jgi:hypothetical protein
LSVISRTVGEQDPPNSMVPNRSQALLRKLVRQGKKPMRKRQTREAVYIQVCIHTPTLLSRGSFPIQQQQNALPSGLCKENRKK